jgi:hypothetical protein
MLVEGVEHAGVERERRSGASSVALEFKTPRINVVVRYCLTDSDGPAKNRELLRNLKCGARARELGSTC